jgi:uncharacterized protein (DUF1015 family)
MDTEGLTILPTHRVVHGLQDFVPGIFLQQAQAYFEIEELGNLDADRLVQRLAKERASGSAFVAVTSRGCHLLKVKPDAADEALHALPERLRRLDIHRLHCLVLEELLGITPDAIREQSNLRYLRDAAEAIEQVAESRANIAFLVNPVPLDQLREIAFAGERMPQKSTDFYPKLLSGLTIYALD